MVDKLLIVLMSSLIGSMGGVYFFRRGKRREAFFLDMLGLVEAIHSEVRFSRNKLSQIVREYASERSAAFEQVAAAYLAHLDGAEFALERGDLLKGEYDCVRQFLLSLGKTDADTQLIELESYKQRLSRFYDAAKLANQKYATAYIKLGALFGLGVGILFL